MYNFPISPWKKGSQMLLFQAVDCFCSWQACPVKRDETAYKIGTFLSMPKSKVSSEIKFQKIFSVNNQYLLQTNSC